MAFRFDYFYRWNTRFVQTSQEVSEGGTPATGAISEIVSVNLAPNKLLFSDAGGKIIVSPLISSAEASTLEGIDTGQTIQQQLDAKQGAVTTGDLTEATSSVLTLTGNTDAIIGAGLTIQVKQASAILSGYLSSTDWSTFNSKLTSSLLSARIFVGNGSNVATGVAVTGDITIDNAGLVGIAAGVIVDADVSGSAGITRSKTASGTAYRILANNVTGVMSENAALTATRIIVADANGQLTSSAATVTHALYISTLTDYAQLQMDTKITGKATNALVQAPTAAQDGFAITWDDGAQEWNLTDPVVQGIPVAGSTNQALIKYSGLDYEASWTDILVAHISDISGSVTAADLIVLGGADAAGVTPTIIGYLGGGTPLSSSVQDQLDSKQSSSLAQNALWVGNASGVATQLSPGTNGYILTSVSGSPQWQPPGSGSISGLTSNRIPYASSSTSLTDDSALTWDSTNNALTVDGVRILGGGAIANTFVGEGSGNFTTGGAGSAHNVGVGRNAGNALTTGSQNTLIGSSAGQSLTNGGNNTLIGNLAGGNLTGSNNVFIGYHAGDSTTSGSNNIVIGADSDVQGITVSNQLTIQNAIFGLSNAATGTSVSTGFIGIYQPAPTYQLHITGHSANQNLFLVEENGGANILEIIEAAGVNKIGFFAAAPVAQQAGLTAITHTAPGAPDYAIQDLVQGADVTADFGFATKDEGNTVLSVIKAMHDAMKIYGLLT